MWAVVLGLGKATKCPDGSVHWWQPNQYANTRVDPTHLATENSYYAWCYPTAAASLLGKLANDGLWNTGMKETDKYDNLIEYTHSNNPPARTDPWNDYTWHETNDKFNMGYYMKTNNPTAGTTLENGKKGIEDFIDYADSSKEALVTIHSGYPAISEKFPLLLHIAARCIPTTESMKNSDNPIILLQSNNYEGNTVDLGRINNSPENLGHTVVAYEAENPTNAPTHIHYKVSMNLPTHANTDGKSCQKTILQVSPDQTACIQNYTTVQLQDKETDTTDTKEEFPLGAIIGIAVGGTVLLAFVGYKIYRWQFPPNPRVLSPVANQNSLIF